MTATRLRRSAGVLALAALAFSAARAADDLRVNASILPQGRIDETTQIRLVVTIQGSSIPEASAPALPPMTNLKIVGGPSTARSSSYVFDNGRINASNSYAMTYYLVAKGPGPAEVPPFDINVGGTSYRTQALRFKVEAGRSGPAPPSSGRSLPGEAEIDDTGDDGSPDVFLQAKVASPSVWAGQATVLELTLYSVAAVSGFKWTEEPSFPGVWAEELPVDTSRERRNVTLNGRNYVAFPLTRRLVVPTRAGTIAIPPFTAQVQVQRSTRDPFGAFFSLGGFMTLVRRTNPVKLEVRPLPEAGRPAEFSGAVGTYRMKAVVDRQSVDVGDAIAVRATIEGTGSLQSASPPRLTAPPDVKMYEPKVVDESATGADHLTARKTWEWVVVPLAPGALRVPSPQFSYFDAGTGAYKELRDDLPEIAVHRGAVTPDTGLARGEVQTTSKDIAFIKRRSGGLREAVPPLHRRGWFVALLLAPFVLVPAGILLGRRRERYLTDHGFARARRAARAAARRLDRAAARAGESSAAFHQEVAGALVDYVADRANRPAAGLTYDDLDDILGARGISDELRRRYRSCLETCDFARFVPDSGRPEARSELVGEARAIVRALEEAA